MKSSLFKLYQILTWDKSSPWDSGNSTTASSSTLSNQTMSRLISGTPLQILRNLWHILTKFFATCHSLLKVHLPATACKFCWCIGLPHTGKLLSDHLPEWLLDIARHCFFLFLNVFSMSIITVYLFFSQTIYICETPYAGAKYSIVRTR